MKILVIAFVLLFLANPAQARVISITTSSDTIVMNTNSADFNVTVLNSGDESAYDVKISLLLPDGFSSKPVFVGKLDQNSRHTTIFNVILEQVKEGEYSFATLVEYKDANKHPFSAVSPSTIVYKTPSSSRITAAMQPTELKNTGRLVMDIRNLDDKSHDVAIKLYLPNELVSRDSQRRMTLTANENKQESFAIENVGALDGSSYAVFAVLSYENGQHYSHVASGSIRIGAETKAIEEKPIVDLQIKDILLVVLTVIIIIVVTYLLGFKKKLKHVKKSIKLENRIEFLINILILIVIWTFLFTYFKPELLFSVTTTSGGDTASHYYPAHYMKNYLLPNWKIVGWSPGWYAGVPMFQFYFPLTFILMAFLSFFLPLQISFKIITILGTFLLPVAAFLAMRIMKFKFPIPILASVFTLPFLFNTGNSMWGGNIPSTLAGEFSESFSIPFMLLFLSLFYRGIVEKRFLLKNTLLFSVVFFSHLATALVSFFASVFFLFTRSELFKNFKYLSAVFFLSFLLVAFWFLPLITKLSYTTPFTVKWYYSNIQKEIFPDILLPFYALATYGVYIALREKEQRILFLTFPAIISIFLYYLAPQIGIIEIRFLPFLQLFPLFIAAYGLTKLFKKISTLRLFPIIVLVITLIWVYNNSSYIQSWIQWNYSGFESKSLWPAYIAVNNFLKGDQNDPRIVYEHSSLHDAAGTPRAFESLPLFSGRSTLEGLYLQSSISAPFIFYIQSEISEATSCPFPEWKCTTFNSTKAAKHLEMFNVKHVIARTDKVKNELKSNNLYQLVANLAPFEIYELKTNDGHYVTVPKYEPVLFETDNWKNVSYYKWFSNEDLLDIPLVFTKDAKADSKELKLVKNDGSVDNLAKVPIDNNCNIQEKVENEEIIFKTNCVGKPHVIRISYFPNWQVEGADRVYLVSPSFMLVFPKQESVRLFYDDIWSDSVGKFLSVIGFLVTILLLKLISSRTLHIRLILFVS